MRAPIQKSRTTIYELGEKSLFLQLLTINAERRPWNCREAFVADGVAAIRADGVVPLFDPSEGVFDQHEQVPLAVGKREVQLFGVCAGRFVGQILAWPIIDRVPPEV